ncbi:kinase-like domain-containing protein [Rhodocollybia butyracea]|uniref:Kinase-like domain-containing protein n=1 Tax=Rhodocollybia butyracea TaxID=206335 RepID=A0A9P5PMJ9_9AGAR|nr:kinase-like domain-containing protein [Rhodocollybia butyracea]
MTGVNFRTSYFIHSSSIPHFSRRQITMDTPSSAWLLARERMQADSLKLKDFSNLHDNLVAKDIVHNNLEIWSKLLSGETLYVKISDVPGTLSGDILRLLAPIPYARLSSHCEIKGNDIIPIAYKEPAEESEPTDYEDTSDLVAKLPLVVNLDLEKLHFTKKSNYRSEIPSLLRANEGPGDNSHVIQLLGRTQDGRLVFPKCIHGRFGLLALEPVSLATMKHLILNLADAVVYLHSIGIIHRDLALRNILLAPSLFTSSDGHTQTRDAILCDLECYIGSFEVPEIHEARYMGLPVEKYPYSEKSDVYGFGKMITDFIRSDLAWTMQQPWLPPPPFDEIVVLCTQDEVDARPTMKEVRDMIKAISV